MKFHYQQNQRYYDSQAAYIQHKIDRQAESDVGSFTTNLADVGRGIWNGVTSGLRRVTNSIRRAFYEEKPEEKQAFALQAIASSGAWAFPAAGVATALVFRTQIEGIIDDIFGKL